MAEFTSTCIYPGRHCQVETECVCGGFKDNLREILRVGIEDAARDLDNMTEAERFALGLEADKLDIHIPNPCWCNIYVLGGEPNNCKKLCWKWYSWNCELDAFNGNGSYQKPASN